MQAERALTAGAHQGNITFGNDNVRWNHSLRVERCLGAQLQVIGIVDPSVDRITHVLAQKALSEAAVIYQDTKHYLALEEAASDLKRLGLLPDLIILGAPPHFRGTTIPGRDLEQNVIAAFGSKPALFCEKPISTALPSETLPVLDLLAKSGNRISVGYMLRYLKVVQKAMSIIQENDLTIMSINARYTCAYSTIRKPDWWDKSKQGGPIVEQATHFCDLCRYFGGDVVLDTVQAFALEHYEKPGKPSRQAIDESKTPRREDPKSDKCHLVSFVKFSNGALGSLSHLVALHDIQYFNEIVITVDGYQLRLTDLYTVPTLRARTPESEEENAISFLNDDPFISEFAAILKIKTAEVPRASPRHILSSYEDAFKTYEFTWKIREASERHPSRATSSRATAFCPTNAPFYGASWLEFSSIRQSISLAITEYYLDCLRQLLLFMRMSSFETEKHAQAAIRDVKLGVAVRESARTWSASRSYIQRRLAGVPTRSEFNKDLQVLPPLLEAELAYWAVGQARLDAPELANIPPERFYNTDEMGIGQGVGGWLLGDFRSHQPCGP
ncbi:uncharacterized protein PG998_014542 [Apiospora kogelbergensis]|uniref:uncharacterized protein n=1 Tax=Apiospora kogelbergensis TaxID=1337665 RepID=UPI00312DC888